MTRDQRAKNKLKSRKHSALPSFSIRTKHVSDGMWQYIIDHARINNLGMLVSFPLISREDLEWRVGCRAEGTFSRQDEQKLLHKMFADHRFQQKMDMENAQLSRLQRKGSWHIKLAFKVNKAIKKWLITKSEEFSANQQQI